jgi:hypothetical protein
MDTGLLKILKQKELNKIDKLYWNYLGSKTDLDFYIIDNYLRNGLKHHFFNMDKDTLKDTELYRYDIFDFDTGDFKIRIELMKKMDIHHDLIDF